MEVRIANQQAKYAQGLRAIAVALVILLSAWTQVSVVSRTVVNLPIRADAELYVSYAWNLRTYHVFSHAMTFRGEDSQAPLPDKMTPPGYPVFLSTLLDGKPDIRFVHRVELVQAGFGVATTLLVLLTALRLLPFGWGIATGTVTAISPHIATISTYLLTEALFTMLVAASLYALVRCMEHGAPGRWHALSGALLGIASLVRPQLVLLPFVLVALGLSFRAYRPRWRAALLGLGCFLVFTLPWQLRNAAVDPPPGDPDLLVNALYVGSFPDMMYRGDKATYGFPYNHDPDQQKHTRDVPAVLSHIADEFRRSPVSMTRWYLLGKPAMLLSWNIVAGMGDVYIYPVTASPYLQGRGYRESNLFHAFWKIAFWLHWPLTIAALLAAAFTLLRPRSAAPGAGQRPALQVLSLVLVVVLLTHMVGASLPRYGIPFRPLIYLLGMVMLHASWAWVREQTRSK